MPTYIYVAVIFSVLLSSAVLYFSVSKLYKEIRRQSDVLLKIKEVSPYFRRKEDGKAFEELKKDRNSNITYLTRAEMTNALSERKDGRYYSTINDIKKEPLYFAVKIQDGISETKEFKDKQSCFLWLLN